MENVMVDLETLGTKPGCAILSIGAVAFDNKGVGEEFYGIINRPSCAKAGLVEEQGTLDWWAKQSPAARQIIEDAGTAPLTLEAGLEEFTKYLSKFNIAKVKVWGNGADFDNAILGACYSAINGGTHPWPFWNNRCYRTLKSLNTSIKMNRQGVHHNALDDAKSQAFHAIKLLNEINSGIDD